TGAVSAPRRFYRSPRSVRYVPTALSEARDSRWRHRPRRLKVDSSVPEGADWQREDSFTQREWPWASVEDGTGKEPGTEPVSKPRQMAGIAGGRRSTGLNLNGDYITASEFDEKID